MVSSLSSQPRALTWSTGDVLAVNLVLHLEEGSELGAEPGDEFQEPDNEAAYDIAPGQREIVAGSFYAYGRRQGFARLLRTATEHEMPVTIFATGGALRNAPAMAALIKTHGCDLVGQGMRWISPYRQPNLDLAADFAAVRSSARDTAGVEVTGWCSRPPAGADVRQAVARHGFLYDSMSAAAERPYFATVDDRPFLVVPLNPDLDDMGFWRRRYFTARDFSSYVIASAENVLREARTATMLTVQMHARVLGRPGRVDALRFIGDWIAKTPGVRVLTRLAVARDWVAQTREPNVWNWPC